MDRDSAEYLLEHAHVPAIYANTGICPLCKMEKRGGSYPHKPDCEFVVATKLLEDTPSA